MPSAALSNIVEVLLPDFVVKSVTPVLELTLKFPDSLKTESEIYSYLLSQTSFRSRIFQAWRAYRGYPDLDLVLSHPLFSVSLTLDIDDDDFLCGLLDFRIFALEIAGL